MKEIKFTYSKSENGNILIEEAGVTLGMATKKLDDQDKHTGGWTLDKTVAKRLGIDAEYFANMKLSAASKFQRKLDSTIKTLNTQQDAQARAEKEAPDAPDVKARKAAKSEKAAPAPRKPRKSVISGCTLTLAKGVTKNPCRAGQSLVTLQMLMESKGQKLDGDAWLSMSGRRNPILFAIRNGWIVSTPNA